MKAVLLALVVTAAAVVAVLWLAYEVMQAFEDFDRWQP